MIEFGHFALILGLAFALIQVLIPSLGLMSKNYSLVNIARPVVWGQFSLVLLSFIVLTYAFIVNDFSVKYVADNSNTQLPLIFKISGVWGSHEGSLLLWVLILSSWTLFVSIFSKNIPDDVRSHILVIMGLVSIGFLLFLIFTSNPFERLPIIPSEGRDLNPLLQDIGLAIHPPMLYMGYVGLVVPFAFTISALIRGKLDSTWLRWSRPWTLVAWSFLTFGITLGSWWAYYELGWGGWWFWDPVENASFMPWLIATALVHSLSVSEKRGAFKHWTVLLAISGFALSLLGTFLVRSGVLTSVHSFAADPSRGLFILLFLVFVVGASLILYAWRGNLFEGSNKFKSVSRESALLLNNIIMVAATLSVLLGTLYPLLLDALDLGKISVGAPYFDAVFNPIMLPALFLMAISPYFRWKGDLLNRVFKMVTPLWVILGVGIVGLFFVSANFYVSLSVLIFAWIVAHSIQLVVKNMRNSARLSGSFIGMIMAHIGIAVFVLGATVTTQLGIEKDIEMNFNDSVSVANYDYKFIGVESLSGPNYGGNIGEIEVSKDGEKLFTLKPEKRFYTSGMPMTEAAIEPSLYQDIYVSLGEALNENSWSLRIYFKPLVRLIWLGGILISIGAILAAFDRRYRMKARA